jgi:hypothetical protein
MSILGKEDIIMMLISVSTLLLCSGTAIWTLGLALICDVVPEARIGVIMGYVMYVNVLIENTLGFDRCS